jgi:hypothetical protein
MLLHRMDGRSVLVPFRGGDHRESSGAQEDQQGYLFEIHSISLTFDLLYRIAFCDALGYSQRIRRSPMGYSGYF